MEISCWTSSMLCYVCNSSTCRSASASPMARSRRASSSLTLVGPPLSLHLLFSSSVLKEHRQSVPPPSLMTRIQFARRPDRRGSALGSTTRALRHPWPSHHLSVCGHLQPCRWSAWWPTSFQAARKRMWIVHWADAQLGTSDAPPQQGTSLQLKVLAERSADDVRSSLCRSDCAVGIKHPRNGQPLGSTHQCKH